MVILVSTLIIMNSSVNSKWPGYGAFYVICPRASSQFVTPLEVATTDKTRRRHITDKLIVVMNETCTMHTSVCRNLPGQQYPKAPVPLAGCQLLCRRRMSRILSERTPPEIHPWWTRSEDRFFHILRHQRQQASSVPAMLTSSSFNLFNKQYIVA